MFTKNTQFFFLLDKMFTNLTDSRVVYDVPMENTMLHTFFIQQGNQNPLFAKRFNAQATENHSVSTPRNTSLVSPFFLTTNFIYQPDKL